MGRAIEMELWILSNRLSHLSMLSYIMEQNEIVLIQKYSVLFNFWSKYIILHASDVSFRR